MKLQGLGLAVLGIAVLQSTAMAEIISGTISVIDPQAKKMTLVRNDGANPLTLSVKDQSQLLGLQPGNKVVVDADRRFFGGWKVDSVTMASETSASEFSDTPTTDATQRQMDANQENQEIKSNEEQLHASEDGRTTAADANPASDPANRDMNPNPTADTTY